MQMTFRAGIVALALLSPALAIAQETPTQEQLQTEISKKDDEIAWLKKELAFRNSDLYEKYKEAKKKAYDYDIKVMELNLETFQTQWLQTYTVMTLVVLVVVAGVVFSGFQLWKSIGTAGVQLNSEMELSAKNVRVTSSVVGIAVLVISIVFLYIYAHEVYQLRFIDSPTLSEPKQ